MDDVGGVGAENPANVADPHAGRVRVAVPALWLAIQIEGRGAAVLNPAAVKNQATADQRRLTRSPGHLFHRFVTVQPRIRVYLLWFAVLVGNGVAARISYRDWRDTSVDTFRRPHLPGWLKDVRVGRHVGMEVAEADAFLARLLCGSFRLARLRKLYLYLGDSDTLIGAADCLEGHLAFQLRFVTVAATKLLHVKALPSWTSNVKASPFPAVRLFLFTRPSRPVPPRARRNTSAMIAVLADRINETGSLRCFLEHVHSVVTQAYVSRTPCRTGARNAGCGRRSDWPAPCSWRRPSRLCRGPKIGEG
jgi:hypothetical protein